MFCAPGTKVLDESNAPFFKWFYDGELNASYNCLDRHLKTQPEKVAIVLSGKPVVSFDNLEEGSMYGGSIMDSALTAYTIDERILGASKNTGDLEVRTLQSYFDGRA